MNFQNFTVSACGQQIVTTGYYITREFVNNQLVMRMLDIIFIVSDNSLTTMWRICKT